MLHGASRRMRLIAVTAVAMAQAPQGGRRGAPPGAGRPGGSGGARGGGIFPRVPALPFPNEARTFDTIHQRIRVVPYVRSPGEQ